MLNGLELDIYIASQNIAIEMDGYVWHKDTQRDAHKDRLCNELGITLYRVRDKGCDNSDVLDMSKVVVMDSYKISDIESMLCRLFS